MTWLIYFQNHRGLYDDVKITPFVDEKIEDTDTEFGQNWNKLGNDDKSFEKYNKMYDLYHKQTGRIVSESENKDGETAKTEDNDTIDSKDDDSVDTSSLPVEGGIEPEESGRRRKSDGDEGKKHRHVKSRTYRVHPKERKQHKLHSQDLLKEDKSTKTGNKISSELNSDNLPDEREDIFKFLDEDPDFKKNVGVITDVKVGDTSTEKAVNVPDDDSNNDDDLDESKDIGENSDDKDLDKFYDNKAEDDSNDQDSSEFEEEDEDEDDDAGDDDDDDDVSKDLSSEMYDDAYEYYDGEEESSYSSSEMEENKHFFDTETPYDWFKEYDKVYGKKETSKAPKTDVKQSTQIKNKNENTKGFNMDYYVNDEPVTDPLEEKVRKLVDVKESDIVDKTDSTLEPSTSPNPPTEKKEWKPMVTQPAHSERKLDPEYVTYIESRPVGRWKTDVVSSVPVGIDNQFNLHFFPFHMLHTIYEGCPSKL